MLLLLKVAELTPYLQQSSSTGNPAPASFGIDTTLVSLYFGLFMDPPSSVILLTLSVGGAADSAAKCAGWSNSKLAAARMGGVAAGAGLFMYGVHRKQQQNLGRSREAAQVVGAGLVEQYRQVAPSKEQADLFAERMAGQDTMEGVVSVLQTAYQNNEITDEMIDSFGYEPEKVSRGRNTLTTPLLNYLSYQAA